MGARWITGMAALMLAGCVGRPAPITADPLVVAAPAPPAPTPINAALSPAATLWHLRSGLNVAALACRGPEAAALAGRYNAWLVKAAEALAAAQAGHEAEYAAAGAGWRERYDDDQTRLYNFFGQPRGRAAFCSAAGEALATLAPNKGAGVVPAPAEALAALDRAFAPPRLAVDPRVFTAPAKVMVATR